MSNQNSIDEIEDERYEQRLKKRKYSKEKELCSCGSGFICIRCNVCSKESIEGDAELSHDINHKGYICNHVYKTKSKSIKNQMNEIDKTLVLFTQLFGKFLKKYENSDEAAYEQAIGNISTEIEISGDNISNSIDALTQSVNSLQRSAKNIDETLKKISKKITK